MNATTETAAEKTFRKTFRAAQSAFKKAYAELAPEYAELRRLHSLALSQPWAKIRVGSRTTERVVSIRVGEEVRSLRVLLEMQETRIGPKMVRKVYVEGFGWGEFSGQWLWSTVDHGLAA